jgi:hypothetical protein
MSLVIIPRPESKKVPEIERDLSVVYMKYKMDIMICSKGISLKLEK